MLNNLWKKGLAFSIIIFFVGTNIVLCLNLSPNISATKENNIFFKEKIPFPINNPVWQWARKAGGTDFDEVHGVAVDSGGNAYITGKFSGTATFGSITLTCTGISDTFVAKLDTQGNWQWVRNAGGTDGDEGYGVAVDNGGNAYITGGFLGTVTFGSTTLISTGSNAVFVVKIDTQGNWQWAQKAGGADYDEGHGVAVDSSGNAYITGIFSGTATFGSTTLTSAGYFDVFVAKIDSQGNWQWAQKAGGASGDYGWDVVVDSGGNVYATGEFWQTATFGSTTLTSTGGDDVFVTKIDSQGNWQWAQKAGGISNDFGRGVAVDSSGNTYITGSFPGTATFGSTTLTSTGHSDVFMAKIDSQGNWQWAQKAGGTDDDRGYDVAVDSGRNAYITGYFYGTATFGSTTLTSTGGDDIFVAKIDTQGNWQWTQKAGGTDYDEGCSVAVDSSGNVYVTGHFSETATFGSTTLTSTGWWDVFVTKLSDGSGHQPPQGLITPITYASTPSIQIGGTYYTWYRIQDPTATILLDAQYLEVTQPDANGYFATFVDTSKLSITPPYTLHIVPSKAQAVINGVKYILNPIMFTYDLTITNRDYRTYWSFTSASGIGAGIEAYIKGDIEGKLNLEYSTQDEFRLQRLHGEKFTFGAEENLFDLEAGPIKFALLEGEIHYAGKQIRESGMLLDYANPTIQEKAVMALYLLSSIISYARENVYLDPALYLIAAELYNYLVSHGYLIEYQGSGVGFSLGAGAYLFDIGVGKGDKETNFKLAVADLGIEGEIGCDYRMNKFNTFKQHIFETFLDYSAGLHVNFLGKDLVPFNYDDYLIAGLEINDYPSGPAKGTLYLEKETSPLWNLDSKKAYYNFGDISGTPLYAATVGTINNPIKNIFVCLNIPQWTAQLQNEIQQSDVTVTATKGINVDIPISLEITVLGVKVYLAKNLGFQSANEYTEKSLIQKNNKKFPIEQYTYDTHVNHETIPLASLLANLFSLDAIWNVIATKLGEITDKLVNTVDHAVEVVSDAGRLIIKKGTQFWDWVTPGHQDNTNQVNITIIVHNQTSNTSDSASRFLSKNGIPPQVLRSMNAVEFGINKILEIQPFNISFSPAAELMMNYTEDMITGINETMLQIYQWQEEKHVWKPLESMVNTSANEVHTNISRFGSFVIGYDTTPPSITYLNMSHMYQDTISFYASIIDNGSGVNTSSISFTVDNQSINYSYDIISGMFSATINVTPGVHTLKISACDMNRNNASATKTAENLHPCRLRDIHREILPQINRVNITWTSINGTYPIDHFIILHNGTFINNITTPWYNESLTQGVYIIVPVDTHDYGGLGLTVTISAPYATIDYWHRGNGTVLFNASASSDYDGNITEYLWDFGDGTNASGITVSHTYPQNGNYTVHLTLTDNDGYHTEQSITITIDSRPHPVFINMMHSQWNFVSLPFNPSIHKNTLQIRYNGTMYTWQEAVNQSLILRFIYGWNRTRQIYELTDILDPGNGYWMYAYHDCELWAHNVSTFTSEPYLTTLLQTWNLIGSPDHEPIEQQNLTILYNGTLYSWQEAVTKNIILGFIYEWNETIQNFQLTNIVQPGKAYWMYAYQNCILLQSTI